MIARRRRTLCIRVQTMLNNALIRETSQNETTELEFPAEDYDLSGISQETFLRCHLLNKLKTHKQAREKVLKDLKQKTKEGQRRKYLLSPFGKSQDMRQELEKAFIKFGIARGVVLSKKRRVEDNYLSGRTGVPSSSSQSLPQSHTSLASNCGQTVCTGKSVPLPQED
ncbi:hypothetical protein QFC19_008193 [Naganishia cerealis]|uniref:Uncharacterized protein n=1 Tax=Naganishia cerealis TaxID=610337 RepID=A0ACC2V456_9TREE|nr:hypothetical protein QFC19_008193 [Naganishia cerealis]